MLSELADELALVKFWTAVLHSVASELDPSMSEEFAAQHGTLQISTASVST